MDTKYKFEIEINLNLILKKQLVNNIYTNMCILFYFKLCEIIMNF